jgi:Ca2+-binding EF-hand superfamily protein
MLDENGDGQITLEEFANAASSLGLVDENEETEFESQLDEETLVESAGIMFDRIDRDSSGSIDAVELEIVLRELGTSADPRQQARALMRVLDRDESGEVSKSEFLELARSGTLHAILSGKAELDLDANDHTASESANESSFSTGLEFAEERAAVPYATRMQQTSGTKLRPPTPSQRVAHISEQKRNFLWDIFLLADDDGSGTCMRGGKEKKKKKKKVG